MSRKSKEQARIARRDAKRVTVAVQPEECLDDFSLDDVLAHELGHVITHVAAAIPFDYVWVRGINKSYDEWHGKDRPNIGGCVGTYYYSKEKSRMSFDGQRVRKVKGDKVTADEHVIILLAGCAGSEILRGVESPRSVIEIQKTYHGMSQDIRMAADWIKDGVDAGYFHANEVWRVLQHYYIEAFDIVRDHKEFLLEAMPLIRERGRLGVTDIMTLWNKFYKIEPETKAKKETGTLSSKDNSDTITLTDMKGDTMKFTEHEIFVLHTIAAAQAKAAEREAGAPYDYSPTRTTGNRFAYVDGRRYDTYGINKKWDGINYLLQRMGLLTATKNGIAATIPDGILPPIAPVSVWAGDVITATDLCKKSVSAAMADPQKYLTTVDIKHVTQNYPAPTDIVELAAAIDATVKEICKIEREVVTTRLTNDLLGRPVSGLTKKEDIKLRFVLELSLPALKATLTRIKKDYDAAKPEGYDGMKKREQEKSGWHQWTSDLLGNYIEYVTDGRIDFDNLALAAGHLTATAAHAGWRIEAARRHPDQGGSAEASAAFGEVWDRIEKSFPKAVAGAAA